MEKGCYCCKKIIAIGSLKTSRTRFAQMGLTAPEGMSSIDRICTKCLQEIYEKQVKQSRIKKLKEDMKKDLISHKNKDHHLMPKNIKVEKKNKFVK